LKRKTDDATEKVWELSSEFSLLPLHRVLLGHDGSMTKLLELIFCEGVDLHPLKQEVVPCPPRAAQLLNLTGDAPVNEREILLVRSSDGFPLVHAVSHAPLSRLEPPFREDLMRADIPIGSILRDHEVEARREVLKMGSLRSNPRLSTVLRRPGPYLWRTYIIITQERPLIAITESFSAALFATSQSRSS
jgi:beta-ribofuranosylaminobenzene 5'-phosphate synthase